MAILEGDILLRYYSGTCAWLDVQGVVWPIFLAVPVLRIFLCICGDGPTVILGPDMGELPVYVTYYQIVTYTSSCWTVDH